METENGEIRIRIFIGHVHSTRTRYDFFPTS
jgi:hypothetical protein